MPVISPVMGISNISLVNPFVIESGNPTATRIMKMIPMVFVESLGITHN